MIKYELSQCLRYPYKVHINGKCNDVLRKCFKRAADKVKIKNELEALRLLNINMLVENKDILEESDV